MAQCDVQALLQSASCFACQSPGLWPVLELQLLCEILNVINNGGGGGGGGQQIYQFNGDPNGNVTPVVTTPVMCIDTLNHIVWVKFDGVASNTGWTSP